MCYVTPHSSQPQLIKQNAGLPLSLSFVFNLKTLRLSLTNSLEMESSSLTSIAHFLPSPSSFFLPPSPSRLSTRSARHPNRIDSAMEQKINFPIVWRRENEDMLAPSLGECTGKHEHQSRDDMELR